MVFRQIHYLSSLMRKKLFVYVLLFSAGVIAQVNPQMGARSHALGNTSLGLTDVWSVYNNPGAFAQLEKTTIGISSENRFLVKELSNHSLAVGIHTKKNGNFGFHMQHYGFNLYREMNSGIAYGMKLTDNFSAGINVNYHGIFLAENYGSKNTLSAGIGLLYKPLKNLTIGMRVQNVSRTRLSEFDDERLPTNFGLGFLYQVSKKTIWTLEAEKDIIHPINIKSGLEIQAHELLQFDWAQILTRLSPVSDSD
jgi:hypothetical protein